jgi:hypothetical protein
VILGDRKTADLQPDGQTTLDDVFRRAVTRRPNATALSDPPNRTSFTDGPPRRFSYAEADRVVSAIAARLTRLGLQPDTVVGILLPNTVEVVLTMLGVMRAGMIAAPLPLLWRSAEAGSALGRVGAKVIITTSRIGRFQAGGLAMQVAAELFPIRYVCAFGAGLPDGVIPLDGLLSGAAEPPVPVARDRDPGRHVALVTWEVTRDGLVPVARNHAELIAGGLAALLEGGLEEDASMLACHAPSAFAGMAVAVVPWLLAGGTLALHHGFDGATFAAQCNDARCDTLAVPGALVPALAEAGLLAFPGLRNVLAVWRAPERLSHSPTWRHPSARLTDLLAFGEIALLGSQRGPDGRPADLPSGELRAPRGSAQAVWVAEVARTMAGTLALRGPMVPRHPFPPGAERLPGPHLRADRRGFVDTLYACRPDPDKDTVLVTAPPPGTVSVGGYRLVLHELENQVRHVDGDATLAALPDALAGHRLAGHARDPEAVHAALLARGANPLVAGAFRDRRAAAATQAPGTAVSC